MTVALVRLDDRLVHGQVVVGWANALRANRIALVDDRIVHSAWERELYCLGVPPDIRLDFESVESAAGKWEELESSDHRTIVLTGDIDTLVRLCDASDRITEVNLGGLHQSDGRTQRLPYVFLSNEEMEQLKQLSMRGIRIAAQDVPTARPVALEALL